jgi:nicotinate-nucleotide adenylyltransferase
LSDRERIGVFGGTFDPIHVAHLAIARAALNAGSVDRVLFVVAAAPPHKANGTTLDARTRYRLVEAALSEDPAIEACDVELNRTGPSYTVETLCDLNRLYPDAELVLIMGLDSVADLPTWHKPDEILTQASILAVARPGSASVPVSIREHVTLLPFDERDISSTDVRNAIRDGAGIKDVLPEAVATIIQVEGLYR